MFSTPLPNFAHCTFIENPHAIQPYVVRSIPDYITSEEETTEFMFRKQQVQKNAQMLNPREIILEDFTP